MSYSFLLGILASPCVRILLYSSSLLPHGRVVSAVLALQQQNTTHAPWTGGSSTTGCRRKSN